MENKIINTPSDIERSATDGPVTRRSLYTNTAQNRNLPTKLQLAVNGSFAGQTKFDEFVQFESIEQLHQALSELIIRFDTRPDYYTKKDYQLLIGVLVGGLSFLNQQQVGSEEIEEVKGSIESLTTELLTYPEKFTAIESNVWKLEQESTTLKSQISSIETAVKALPTQETVSKINTRLESVESLIGNTASEPLPEGTNTIIGAVNQVHNEVVQLKSPVAKRVWETKEEMVEYISNVDISSSPAGVILNVTNDSKNTGTYLAYQTIDAFGVKKVQITKLSTGEQEQITISIHEDSAEIASLINNVLKIEDMRSRWERNSF